MLTIEQSCADVKWLVAHSGSGGVRTVLGSVVINYEIMVDIGCTLHAMCK